MLTWSSQILFKPFVAWTLRVSIFLLVVKPLDPVVQRNRPRGAVIGVRMGGVLKWMARTHQLKKMVHMTFD